jgi:hypothetical protein
MLMASGCASDSKVCAIAGNMPSPSRSQSRISETITSAEAGDCSPTIFKLIGQQRHCINAANVRHPVRGDNFSCAFCDGLDFFTGYAACATTNVYHMRPLIDASCYCAAIKVSSFYILKHGEMPAYAARVSQRPLRQALRRRHEDAKNQKQSDRLDKKMQPVEALYQVVMGAQT